MPKELAVFLLSALPVIELRGGIPLGLALGLSPLRAFMISAAGNMLPIIPLLILLEPARRWLSCRSAFFNRFFSSLIEKTNSKHSDTIQRYGAVGLAIFVAIPAPGTGAWSGCLVAFLLGMPFRYALPAIVAGVIGAGLLVTGASTGALAILNALFSPGASVVLLLALALVVFALMKRASAGRN